MFVNAPAGFTYPGDPGFPGGNTGLVPKWWNFSPRVGVAWDVTGDGRMAVRTSYGVAYDFPTAERHNINTQSPPWGNRSLIENPPGGFDDPYGHIGGDPHPIVAAREVQFIPFGAFGATDPDIDSPRVQSWNVTLERQLGEEWGVGCQLPGQLHGSAVGADAAEPRCVPRAWPVRDQRPVVSGLQHGGEPERAPRPVALG